MKKIFAGMALLLMVTAGSVSQAAQTLNPGIGEFAFSLSAGEKDTSESAKKAEETPQYFQISGCNYNGDIVHSSLEFRAVSNKGVLMSDFKRYKGAEPFNVNYTSYAAPGGEYRLRGRVAEGGTGGTIEASGTWRP